MTPSRALTVYERFYVCRNIEHYYTNVNVTVKYNLPISKSLLCQGLTTLVHNHISFTFNAFTETPELSEETNGMNWEFRPVKSIKFDDVVIYKTIEKFDNSILAEVDQYKIHMNVENIPLWRIFVYEIESTKEQYICFCYDHSVFDGTSGRHFFEDLAVEFSKITGEPEFQEVIFDLVRDSKFVPEVLESPVMKPDVFAPTYYERAMKIATAYFPRIVKSLDYFKAKDPLELDLEKNPLYSSPIIPHLIAKHEIINFTPEQVSSILKFCRSQNITLTPYFHTLLLQTIEEVIHPVIDPETKFSTQSLSAIDVRRYLPKDEPFKYGIYVAADAIVLPPVSGKTLERMKYQHNSFKTNLENKSSCRSIGQYLAAINFWSFHRASVDQGRKMHALSNLGRIPDSGTKYKIVDAYFNQSIGRTYHNLFNMVSTEEGGLNMVYTYLPEAEIYNGHPEVMEKFFSQLKANLVNFATA